MTRLWLLTTEIAGQPVRWSSEPVDIITADGSSLPYGGGLSVETVEQAAQGPGEEPIVPRIGIEAAYPEELDLIELIEAGHRFAEGVTELAMWSPGQTYEQRTVYVRGFLDEEEVDIAGRAVRGSVTTRDRSGDGASVPADGAAVSTDTWADLAAAWKGAIYPVPIGRPGAGDGITHPACPARPVLLTTYGPGVVGPLRLIIADRPVAASQVRLWYGPDATDGGLFAVSEQTDSLGRTVSTVLLSGASDDIKNARQWWTSWEEGAGVLLPDGSPVETLGDALYWAAHASGLTSLDLRAWSALRGTLAAVKIGAVIDTRTAAWPWAVEVLVPLAPLELVDGPDGVRPLLWSYPATTRDVVRHLEEGRDIHRAGPIERASSSDVVNQWRLRFGFRPDGDPSQEVLVGGEARPAPACTVSQAAEVLVEKSLDLVAVSRQSAATYAASWRAASQAIPWRTTTYGGLADDIGDLEPGAVVTITDSERAWVERIAHVRAVRWLSTDEIELALLLLAGVGHAGVD